jgi:ATP-binding cassette subfamily C protein CydD
MLACAIVRRGVRRLSWSRMSADTAAWLKTELALGRRAAITPVLLGVVQSLGAIGQAFCVAMLLAALLTGSPHHSIGLYVIGFAAFALLRAGVAMRAEQAGFERGAAARRRLRSTVLGALLALGPAGLRGRHSAELANVAVDRIEAMEGFHARWISATVLAVIGPVLVGAAALAADWRSGLILGLAGLAVPVAMALAGIGAGLAARKQFIAMTHLQVRFLDRIRGISTIVLAGRQADETATLAKAGTELRIRTMRVLRVAFLSSTALDLAAAAALVLIVLRFIPALHLSLLLAPKALFLLFLVPEFFAPLRSFAAVYQDRMAAAAVAEDLAGLPAAPAELPPLDIRSVAAPGFTLAFEDVSYAWNRAQPVLEHFSFRIASGEMLLLTGASGAGKSTIIDLILGFIKPNSGRVTINGAAIETITAPARANLIGWIGQKPMIFAGTIGENIKFARPQASEAELAEAFRLASLSDVIAALPQGLETRIGEGGFGLSGGQAQRIAIARAFLKDAPVLLLDEPTAHLDPAVERDILSSIKRLAIGRTVILASHSSLAAAFARDTGARRLDLDALRHARRRGAA